MEASLYAAGGVGHRLSADPTLQDT